MWCCVSAVYVSQIHLRHLVGGRARSYMGEIPNERMFQVRSPPDHLVLATTAVAVDSQGLG